MKERLVQEMSLHVHRVNFVLRLHNTELLELGEEIVVCLNDLDSLFLFLGLFETLRVFNAADDSWEFCLQLFKDSIKGWKSFLNEFRRNKRVCFVQFLVGAHKRNWVLVRLILFLRHI